MLLLLVEDDLALAELVIEFLQEEGMECDHTVNGHHALELIQQHKYEVIILDINLPGQNGFDVCQTMRSQGIKTPCIMLTARDSVEDRVTGLGQGADDYLVKPFAMAELVARLQALVRRHDHQTQLSVADLTLFVEEHRIERGGQSVSPSPEEWKLLLHLVRQSPSVVPRSELEDLLWPEGAPSKEAFKMVVYRLRKLVDGGHQEALLHTVRGVGLVLRA
ncbi:response regulator transcription factor [Pleionea sp. CnH1-48]|uniref:response regulator transcription factor n=1 Tax=Pleionea sp. CnH1-48 TaxID=2954494 RepID=UPI0020982F22|nr:response regulator transcription factor [Pleionea sp. CnH1-48]MCO7224259.1 response regulator transcription factor [Pleionea sp. CnH1-48]